LSKVNNPDKPSRSCPGHMLKAKTFIIAIILLSGLLNLNVPAHPIGTATPPHSIHFATAADPNNLGINCAYGALDATGLPITTEDGDGTLNTSCQWAGDVDGDTAPDPLVSDNPSTALAGSGGGFTADIIITSLDPSLLGINGFDQTISYDTHVLNAVLVDQSGLTFGGNLGCNPAINPSCTVTTALTIDRVGGTVRLAQAVLGITVGPGGSCSITAKPDCTSPTQTLFRIRFDVVGAGTGFIKFSTDPTKNVITCPCSVPHTSQDGALGTDTFFSAINGVVGGTFEVNWTFSPSPEVPGKSLTFSAPSVTCTYCTGTLTYTWDFSSLDSPTYAAKVDATGMMATVTPPPPVIHRVTLTVTDGTHKASATRLLPLVVTATGPTTVAQGAPSTAFNGIWLGGVVTSTSGYSGLWRFCPGTNLNKLVCNTPSSAVSQSGASITQTSAVSSVIFNFAGLYNDFLSLSDTIVSQISPTANTGVAPVPVNVTGSTPAYTVTVSPSLTTINAGQSVDFTVSVIYAGTYPPGFKSTSFNYFFDFGDGSTNTVSSGTSVTFSHTFNLGGTFIVRVTPQETGNAAPNKIQENGYSSVITVIPPLAASFTFSPPLPSAGQEITFTPTVTGGNPLYSFAWDFGDGSTSTLQSPTHSYATSGSFTVALTVTDSTTPTPQTRKTSQMITVYPPAFDFGVVWSPASASVTAGGSSSPDVVATLVSGTSTSAACSVSLPSPAVAGLSAVPLTFSLMPSAAGASQAVAIATTSATPAGTYTISVSCAGGGATRAASPQFSLTVTAPAFDYTIAWSPTSASIAAGAGMTPSIVATLTSGTTTAVTCTVSLPSPAVTGLSASPLSFSIAPTLAGATQVVTISTTVFTPGGTYTIGVSCTGGVGTHTANFSLTVTAGAFDYSVAWSPTTAIIAAGAGTSPDVVAILTSGTATSVTCTVSLPSPAVTGLSASPLSFSLTPALAPGASQVEAISTTVFTPGGTYAISVSCTGGVGSHTANFSLSVTAAAFDYTVAWSPTSNTITAGASTTPNVVATLTSGQAASVTCTVTLPSPAVTGLSANPLSFSITPALASGTSQAVTISTTTLTPTGTYAIGVSCTGGVGTHTANFSLTVTAAGFDYTVALSPTSSNIAAGASTTPNVVATLTSGSTSAVTCTVSLPSPAVTGLSASPLSFSISPVVAPGASQAVMISTTVFTPGGTYAIIVSCTGGVGAHTANFSLTVTAAAFDYTVAWSPTSNTVAAGSSTTPNIVATLTSGTTASVTCTISLPSPAVTGLSASSLSFSITPALTPSAIKAVTISTTKLTPAGVYIIGVSCTGGVGTHTANFSLTVSAAGFDYTVAWSPTSATIAAGSGTTPNLVGILTSGQTASVTCTVSLPSPAVTGLSASPLSFSITPDLAPGAAQAVTIMTTTLTPAGTYTIGVSCTGGVGTHTADFSLTVTAAGFDYTVAWSPTSATTADGASTMPNLVATLTSGTAASVTCTVSLPSPAVTGLSASPLSFSITPALAPGATQVVAISTTVFTPGGTYAISVSCTGGVGTHTADFQLTVTAAAFDFGVVWSPASASVTAGGSSSPDVVATLVSGTSTSAACSVSLPSPAVAGLSAVPLTFSLMPSAAGASQAVAIATTSATPAGTYTISVSCAGGGATRAASPQFSLTVTAPVAVPTVTVNSPTPNAANTGEIIMVTFTVTSTTTVTGITVDWGDGTTLDSLAGTATSDHHIYTSTGNLKSQTFTITVTATNAAGPGSGTTMATINDRPPTATISNVSPNPANIGQLVTITFATADPDGTVSSIAVDWGDGLAIDNLSGTATSDTHMYGSANSFTIMVTATDNSGSTGSATAGETVTSVTVTHVLLTFQVQAPQSPSRGPGNLQVFVNGQHVTDITLGLTFTSFGPIDITTFVISGGQNTVTFINPQTNQFNLVKNVTITQGDTILLRVIKTLKVSAGGTLNLTFSLPALATTSITVSSTSPLVGQTVTFTAKFTGGTAPFKCFFQFGDDESAVSRGTSGTCKATHDYDSSGTFTATIVIKGTSKSDRVVAHLSVNVQEDDD